LAVSMPEVCDDRSIFEEAQNRIAFSGANRSAPLATISLRAFKKPVSIRHGWCGIEINRQATMVAGILQDRHRGFSG
jgi:hypothetical protein